MMNAHRTLRQVSCMLTMLMALTSGTIAQDVSVGYTADQTWVDTPIQVQFTIENAQEIGDPVLPEQDGLEIEYLGITNEFSQTSIINGVRTSKRTLSLSVSVNPTRAGTFEIDPITIEVDGTPYSSSPITLKVIAPRNDGRVLVELSGPERSVYMGEPVDLTLSIWVEQFRSEEYDVDASESVTWKLVDLNQTDWGPFRETIQELVNNRQRPKGEARVKDGRIYFAYDLQREVRPADIRELEQLTDVTVAVSYPTGVRRARSIFNSGGLEFSGLIPLRIRADVGEIDITPLPEEGRPDVFRGAVGEFVVRASAKPLRVAAGDPITLSFLVGNVDENDSVLDTLRPPPLDQVEALQEGFRIPSDPIAGTVDGNIKIFTQSIRPRSEDVTEIPAIPFAFFDPDLGEYRTIYTRPIPIEVTPAEMLASDDIVRSRNSELNAPERPGEGRTPTTEADGLLLGANFPVDERLLSRQSITVGWGTFVILGAPPASFLAVLALVARRRWRERNPDSIRARSAGPRAFGAIKRATDLGEVGRQLRSYISDKSGRPPGSITASEAIRLARSADADPGVLMSLDTLLQKTERSGYGGMKEPGSDVSAEATELIRELERCDWRSAGKVHS